MPYLTDGRPLTSIATAALTAYHTVSVAIWALLYYLVARRSKGSLVRELFGVVLAVATLAGN